MMTDPIEETTGRAADPAAENVLDELVDRFNARDLEGVGVDEEREAADWEWREEWEEEGWSA